MVDVKNPVAQRIAVKFDTELVIKCLKVNDSGDICQNTCEYQVQEYLGEVLLGFGYVCKEHVNE